MAHINYMWCIFFVVAASSLLLGIFGLFMLLRGRVKKPSDVMLAHLTVCNMLNVVMYMAPVTTYLLEANSELTKIVRDVLLAIYLPHVLTLVIITTDRILAVQLVFQYKIIVTNKKLRVMFAFVWVLGAMYGVLSYFIEKSVYVSLCFSALVVFFFVVSYIFIIVKVFKSKKAISTTGKSIGRGQLNYWIPFTIIVTYILLAVATDISVIIVHEPTPWHYIAWCSNAMVDTLTYVFGSSQIRSRIRWTRGVLSFRTNLLQPNREPNKEREMHDANDCHTTQ